MKTVYIVFTCDEHKMKASMRPIGVTSGLATLRSNVKKLIKNKVVTCNGTFNVKDQWSVTDMNEKIDGLYIIETTDGYFELNGGYLG